MTKLSFKTDNGPIDNAIRTLMQICGDVHHPDIIREMILAALKAGQEADDRADLLLMNTTLKEMRFTTKIFSPYRKVKKVSVFGSARILPDEPIYGIARSLGKKLAEAGYMVITGGGPGIMYAMNEGAGPENSFGINIRLPFEQKSNPIIDGNPKSITYKYFFNRKIAFLKEAQGVVLFPGGFGTLDEGMEMLTLVQTGKSHPVPVILVDDPQHPYWSSWLRFIENELLTREFIDAKDLDLFKRVESVDEVVAIIDHFYSRYHSIRYVDDRLVIRMNSPIQDEDLRTIQTRFSDILTPGGSFYLSGPLEKESDEPTLAHLPRLVVAFNRKDFGGLHNLIDAINTF